MSTEALTTSSPPPNVRSFFVADIKCYLCGTVIGAIETEHPPRSRAVMFRRVGEQQQFPVLDWRQLRCTRCDGPVFLDETDIITRRTEQYDWMEERPRRGRPPKRLLEKRAQEEEERRRAA